MSYLVNPFRNLEYFGVSAERVNAGIVSYFEETQRGRRRDRPKNANGFIEKGMESTDIATSSPSRVASGQLSAHDYGAISQRK